MQPRLDGRKAAPAALHAMPALETYVSKSSRLEHALLELARFRASRINRCAYCDMHSKDARARGESEQRLYMLSAWRETTLFTDRERAALEWTGAIALIYDGHAPDAAYEEVRSRFREEELVNLTLAIVAINGWNRLAIGFRAVPGEYQPAVRGAENYLLGRPKSARSTRIRGKPAAVRGKLVLSYRRNR